MTSCLISNSDKSNDSVADGVRSITVSGEDGELCGQRFSFLEHSTSRRVKEKAGRRQHITYETAEYEYIDGRGRLLTGDHPTDNLFRVLCYE